ATPTTTPVQQVQPNAQPTLDPRAAVEAQQRAIRENAARAQQQREMAARAAQEDALKKQKEAAQRALQKTRVLQTQPQPPTPRPQQQEQVESLRQQQRQQQQQSIPERQPQQRPPLENKPPATAVPEIKKEDAHERRGKADVSPSPAS